MDATCIGGKLQYAPWPWSAALATTTMRATALLCKQKNGKERLLVGFGHSLAPSTECKLEGLP